MLIKSASSEPYRVVCFAKMAVLELRNLQVEEIFSVIISLFAFCRIPLPGELSGGIPATFDRYGNIRQPKRPFRKKVSPQVTTSAVSS